MEIQIGEDGKVECETYYRVEVIAKLFGVSVRRVQQLTQEGIIETVGVKERGREVRRYNLANTVQRYTAYLSDKAYGRSETEDMQKLLERKLKAEVALKESQSELHIIKKDIAEGKYIEIETVKLDYARFFVVLRKFLLSVPARIAGRIQGYIGPVELRAVEKELTDDITTLLNKFVAAGVEE